MICLWRKHFLISKLLEKWKTSRNRNNVENKCNNGNILNTPIYDSIMTNIKICYELWKEKIFFELLVDSHTVAKINTDRSHISFTQFSQRVTSCMSTVQYYNQLIYVSIFYWSCSDFINFSCTHFYLNLCNFIVCRFLWPLPQSRYRTVLS